MKKAFFAFQILAYICKTLNKVKFSVWAFNLTHMNSKRRLLNYINMVCWMSIKFLLNFDCFIPISNFFQNYTRYRKVVLMFSKHLDWIKTYISKSGRLEQLCRVCFSVGILASDDYILWYVQHFFWFASQHRNEPAFIFRIMINHEENKVLI